MKVYVLEKEDWNYQEISTVVITAADKEQAFKIIEEGFQTEWDFVKGGEWKVINEADVNKVGVVHSYGRNG